MSRASISTGNIQFNTNHDKTPPASQREHGQPMHVVIMGDFSGRASQGICDAQLSTRRIIEIDRDNFDDIFNDITPTLHLPINNGAISFNDIDELHPDYLIEQLDIFETFNTLKRKLKKPELFAQAVEEIQQWSPPTSDSTPPTTDSTEDSIKGNIEGVPLPNDMLDNLLMQSQHTLAEQNALGDINQLVRSIVSPYVQAKENPRLPEMIACVDDAIATTLRKILHASHFQELEANWRALYLLVRRIETSKSLKIFLVDISKDELLKDIHTYDSWEKTQSYQRFVESFQIAGAIAPAILQCNYQVEENLNDMALTQHLAQLAAAHNAIAIGGVTEKIAGCHGFATDHDEWDYQPDADLMAAWHTIREQPYSQHIALSAPRFLLRLPYGKKTSPIDSFPFEELSTHNPHAYYLWANSNTLVTLALTQRYTQYGWEFNEKAFNSAATCPEIGELPVHIYTDEYGESAAKAIAETYITDSEVEQLATQGILTIRSMKNKNAVLIPRFRTLSLKEKSILA